MRLQLWRFPDCDLTYPETCWFTIGCSRCWGHSNVWCCHFTKAFVVTFFAIVLFIVSAGHCFSSFVVPVVFPVWEDANGETWCGLIGFFLSSLSVA